MKYFHEIIHETIVNIIKSLIEPNVDNDVLKASPPKQASTFETRRRNKTKITAAPSAAPSMLSARRFN